MERFSDNMQRLRFGYSLNMHDENQPYITVLQRYWVMTCNSLKNTRHAIFAQIANQTASPFAGRDKSKRAEEDIPPLPSVRCWTIMVSSQLVKIARGGFADITTSPE